MTRATALRRAKACDRHACLDILRAHAARERARTARRLGYPGVARLELQAARLGLLAARQATNAAAAYRRIHAVQGGA